MTARPSALTSAANGLAQEERMGGGWPLQRDPGRLSMTIRQIATCAGFVALAGAMIMTSGQPAQALTMKECSAKYQAAKSAGTLGGQNWRDFRKAQCGVDATAAAPAAGTPAATPATAPKATGSAVFPTAVAPKYSGESAGKARMHTCLDQYNANKAANANGGLKWIQKSGGYYSEGNKPPQSLGYPIQRSA